MFREIADERNAVLLELNDITLAAIERLMTESRLAMGEAFVSMDGPLRLWA